MSIDHYQPPKVLVDGEYVGLPPDGTYDVATGEIIQPADPAPVVQKLVKHVQRTTGYWGPAVSRRSQDRRLETPEDLSYSA